MRDLHETIDKMLEVIPEEETYLRKELLDHQHDLRYIAPEVIFLEWRDIGHILDLEIPHKPRLEWEKKLINIFTGK